MTSPLGLDGVFEVGASGGDDADVHAEGGRRSEGSDFARLEEAEELWRSWIGWIHSIETGTN
jgi:hypothetical protein